MNGRDWLRAVAMRQRKKGFATGGEVSGRAPMQLGGCTFSAVVMQSQLPTGAQITFHDPAERLADLTERLRSATVSPDQLSVGAMRVTSGMQCGCEVRYTRCRCGRGDP